MSGAATGRWRRNCSWSMGASSTARRSGRGMTTGTGSGKYTVIAAKGPGPACGPICGRSVGSISITWPSMWPPMRRCSTPSGLLPPWCNACVVLFLLCTLAAHEPHILRPYEALPGTDKRRIMERYGIKDGIQHNELVSLLLDNIEEMNDGGMMHLDESYVASIVKFRRIIALMQDFYSDMWRNNKKDTKLRHAELRRLLKETGFLPGTGSN